MGIPDTCTTTMELTFMLSKKPRVPLCLLSSLLLFASSSAGAATLHPRIKDLLMMVMKRKQKLPPQQQHGIIMGNHKVVKLTHQEPILQVLLFVTVDMFSPS